MFFPHEERPIRKQGGCLESPSIVLIPCYKLLVAGVVGYAEQLLEKGEGIVAGSVSKNREATS